MRITEVRFRGFKSLLDVTCELEQLTVITGPNGAGKTNLVDGLNFLSECFEFGLEIAVARAGGYANIAHRGATDDAPPVKISLTLEIDYPDLRRMFPRRNHQSEMPKPTTFYVIYEFTLSAESAEEFDFHVSSEYLQLRDKEGRILQLDRRGNRLKFWRSHRMTDRSSQYSDILYPLSDDGFIHFIKRNKNPTVLMISTIRFVGSGDIFDSVARLLGDARVFQLSPHQCRLSGVSTPNARLDRHGENLPAVADYLRRHQPDSWLKIESAMRAVIPQLESIDTTFTTDRQLALQFHETDRERPWNSNEMSDGTVQMLALFVALFDRRLPVLIVEEPENALHPWILRHFLDLCREQFEKQIVLTTHSPVLLDAMSPEYIRLLWSKDGQSRIAHIGDLNPAVVDMWKAGDLKTFEIYDSGIVAEYLPEIYAPRGE
ncbi:AAA family ATPase [Nocardia shimofusensis]|uniref:AAA family ATPase n=1 Tax=Nocardia shimofusensis TaxID=228596 RepID=UPI0014721102|nr:AAA family ATPase [Nocardia shimofusensis]